MSSRWPSTSRHDRGYGAAWNRQRKLVLERDSCLCQCAHCKAEGRVAVATQVDHIVSRSKAQAFGWSEARTESMGNLQAINVQCHVRKTIEEQGKTVRASVRIGADGYPVVD